MLVRADEHRGPLGLRDLCPELVPLVQARWYPQLQDADQLVHRSRRTRAGKDDQVVLRPADRVANHLPGVLAQPGGLQARAQLSVCVLAYRGRTASRMKSSMKSSDRPEAV